MSDRKSSKPAGRAFFEVRGGKWGGWEELRSGGPNVRNENRSLEAAFQGAEYTEACHSVQGVDFA